MFDSTTTGNARRTGDIFGENLHAYTIKHAIADRNVLGFKVDFETTLPEKEIREKILPLYYAKKHKTWSQEKIHAKIAELTPEQIDDAIESDIYDDNEDHIREVVNDIVSKWYQRSAKGKYNAMLTTRVGKGKSSAPMALAYLNEFKRVNAQLEADGKTPLRVAVTFSEKNDNSDYANEANSGLHQAITDYNDTFGTKFSMDDVSAYTQDVTRRLNRTASDGEYLDLVIVNEQLLTGFDAPQLNTLYVDRMLRNASLVQAYSRTNRIYEMKSKPFGRVVNYRWPEMNRKLMDKALAIYANEDSALLQQKLDLDLQDEDMVQSSILARTYEDIVEEAGELVDRLDELTDGYSSVPASEGEQKEVLTLQKRLNMLTEAAQQYTREINRETGEVIHDGFDTEDPGKYLEDIGLSKEKYEQLGGIAYETREILAENLDIPVYQIEFELAHVSEARVNYDYLSELLAKLLNQVHYNEPEEKLESTVREINSVIASSDDESEREEIGAVVRDIRGGHITVQDYPVTVLSREQVATMRADSKKRSVTELLFEFRGTWGLREISEQRLIEMLRDGREDVRSFITEASNIDYATKSLDAEVRVLSKLKYRNKLRDALQELAEELKR